MSVGVNMQPAPQSHSATAPAFTKSFRQPPAFHGTISAQVKEPDAWFDTVVQYLRDTGFRGCVITALAMC